MPHTLHRTNTLLATASSGAVLGALRIFPLPQGGALLGLPTLCPFRLLTTLPCPGCGVTRSLVYCAHGEWQAALAFHPLGLLCYGALWCLFAVGVLSPFLPAASRVTTTLQRLALPITVIVTVAFIACWVRRLTHLAALPPNF
jgi:hypothetical protein